MSGHGEIDEYTRLEKCSSMILISFHDMKRQKKVVESGPRSSSHLKHSRLHLKDYQHTKHQVLLPMK